MTTRGDDSMPEVVTLLEPEKASYSRSPGLFDRLAQLDIALAFTSYQSSMLYLLGSSPDRGPQLHQSATPKPMGLAVCADGELILASSNAIVRYRDVLEADQRINHTFDACYVPRTLHMTGELDAHDVGVHADGRIIFVNTRFNCLATTSERHSFAPVWRPPFISALVDEDRCHLNGLAMDRGRPAFVSAVSRSDTLDGWRDRRADGGVVIDVASGEIACSGLSMPHSPRLYRGELWLLNSGTGELGVVAASGKFEPRVFCPGFTRGLAIHGHLAFVGLSQPRYRQFEGLALDQRLKDADSEPWCGFQVIDLDRGTCVDWFRIDGDVTELYDLAVLAGRRCPMAVSLAAPEAASFITHAAEREARSPLPSAAAGNSSIHATKWKTLWANQA
ncbi:TIGR03032 family protein [soil metagenome]